MASKRDAILSQPSTDRSKEVMENNHPSDFNTQFHRIKQNKAKRMRGLHPRDTAGEALHRRPEVPESPVHLVSQSTHLLTPVQIL
jgi:hypothetical protein